MSTEWFSVEQAGAQLGIGSRTVYGLIDRGELAAYRMGRVYRIRSVDIDAYLETARVQPGTLEHLHPVSKLRVVDAS